MIKVYMRYTEEYIVTSVSSDSFLVENTGWVKVDEGDGDRYMHAQGNYLPKPLMDEHDRYRYKLVDGEVVERTPEELGADAQPATVPSEAERLAAVEAAVLDLVLGGELNG